MVKLNKKLDEYQEIMARIKNENKIQLDLINDLQTEKEKLIKDVHELEHLKQETMQNMEELEKNIMINNETIIKLRQNMEQKDGLIQSQNAQLKQVRLFCHYLLLHI